MDKKKSIVKKPLRPQKGKSIILDIDSYVVLYIQTNGSNPDKHQIQQISAIKIENNHVINSFKANNIYEEQKKCTYIFQKFYDFISNQILIGFNIVGSIDSSSNFLYDALKNEINKYFTNNMIDIVRIAKIYVPNLSEYTIPALCSYYRIPYDEKNICDIINQLYIILREKIPAELEFGCCSRYIECSDNMYCNNPDRHIAKGCHYKKHLDKGQIFYGKNKNIN